jgi:hypothetical protein
MLKDHVVRFCLLAIILLLGIIACRVGPSERVKAAESTCLVEQLVDVDSPLKNVPLLTNYCKQRVAEGWHLQGITGGFFIWVK